MHSCKYNLMSVIIKLGIKRSCNTLVQTNTNSRSIWRSAAHDPALRIIIRQFHIIHYNFGKQKTVFAYICYENPRKSKAFTSGLNFIKTGSECFTHFARIIDVSCFVTGGDDKRQEQRVIDLNLLFDCRGKLTPQPWAFCETNLTWSTLVLLIVISVHEWTHYLGCNVVRKALTLMPDSRKCVPQSLSDVLMVLWFKTLQDIVWHPAIRSDNLLTLTQTIVSSSNSLQLQSSGLS